MRLEMRFLCKRGLLREGSSVWTTWRWTWAGTDDQVGSVGLTVDLSDPADRHALLQFSTGGEPRRQKIAIEALPMPYGGFRYYFRCPRSGDRCEVLGCVSGYFASRRANRLAYASQSEDPLGRLYRARAKAEDRAFGKNGYTKPRGANRERLVSRWIELEEAADNQFAIVAMRRFGLGF